MLFNAFKFGRKIKNAVIFDDTKIEIIVRDGIEKISETSLPELLEKFRQINAKRKAQGLSLFVLALPLSACKGSSSASDGDAEQAPLFEAIT
ncbi:MAG: HAMP domain-containing histidine kinase, partial [Bacteroidetes bacterium]|nr:HAMP domain-containing histidine kinase [Bacteroidota bacterium]